ncbi:MAG TPA: radical SAM protein [Spirochaetia bacterium]|nr:radical SAM protein [Spirochaetia bacterium]
MGMNYDYPLFRPPSEAKSLILQITLGCSHNGCRFCEMYKTKQFQVKPLSLIVEELKFFSAYYPTPLKIFLADGDAMCLPFDFLMSVLVEIGKVFPDVRRISSYSGAQGILSKSDEELKALKKAKLSLFYLGLESGDPQILKDMNKGSMPEENIQAVLKAKKNGIKTSVTAVLGLGGRRRSREHGLATAEAVSQMSPNFFSTLSLMATQGIPLMRDIQSGQFEILNEEETYLELKTIIENIQGENIIFRSNHASNPFPLEGILSRDREKILKDLEKWINFPHQTEWENY